MAFTKLEKILFHNKQEVWLIGVRTLSYRCFFLFIHEPILSDILLVGRDTQMIADTQNTQQI